MSDWKVIKLGQVADFNMGQSPASSDVTDNEGNGIPFLQGNAEFGVCFPKADKYCRAPKKVSQKDDILISVRAPVGALNKSDKVYCIGRGLAAISAKKIDASFLWHLLSNSSENLSKFAQGSTFDAINSDVLQNFDIEIPHNADEQKTIATVLDTVDEAIQSTQAMLDKQDKIKQGLLHDLLTRGVDERGHLRPSPENAPDLYQQTETGLIPKGWKAEKLDQITVKIQDGTHFSPKTGGNDYLYITSKNIRFGFLDITTAETVDAAQHKEIYRRADVKPGDLLLTKDGANTGNAAINTIEDEISLLSSVAFLRFNEKRDSSQFYLQYILSPKGQRRLKDLMSGNAITRLTLEKIRNFYVPRPSFKEQDKIANYLYDCDESTRENEIHLQKLYRLKSGLMQDLLTGRKRVTPALMRDVEKLAEAA